MNMPQINSIGRKTLVLPHCWVCQERFKTSVPPGPANKEEHHIFPRNAGGTDGPLVSLCDRDHSTLHKIAKRVQAKKAFRDLLLGLDHQGEQRLVWLALMVVKAEQLVEGDTNKRLVNTVSLSRGETQMMKRLQSIYPKLGRSEIFSLALRRLYTAHFGNKK
jgi:hypothetical protein